jgi:ketosteroid isomerase-like protein
MGEQSREVVQRMYDAAARGDVAAMLDTMADDIEWHEAEGMPYGGVYRGGEAVMANVLGPINADVDGFTITTEEFIVSGDTVAVIARYTGTGQSTGKPLDAAVTHVWDVRGDKIGRFRQFADTAKFLEVVPADVATTA